MQLAIPVHLKARTQVEASPWEFVLRYVTATAATLLAIGGAQLVVRNDFIVMLVVITLVGVPVSLYLRLSDMRVGMVQIPRPIWNSVTVVGTLLAAAYFVFWSLRDLIIPILNGASPQLFLLRFGAGESVGLLMQVFLLFAAFRSFALISDKDTTLATVPSFSVLLLLIPVHKGIEVVFYFLAWTVVATILFALDHRAEVRSKAVAYVPCISPGQDVRLAGRSLATILGLSLVAAVGVSYYLTSRDPQQRSSAESAISSLATRLTNMALSLPEASVNSGPERQIDFSSSPTPATHSLLWQVRTFDFHGKAVRPEYWRLFTLDTYNGVSWSQSAFPKGTPGTLRVPFGDIDNHRWPNPSPYEFPVRLKGQYLNQYQTQNTYIGGFLGPRGATGDSFPGFDIQSRSKAIARQFGPPSMLLRQNITALLPNLGFVPVIPSVRVLQMPASNLTEIRLSRDGGMDMGVVEPGQLIRVLSDVPAIPEYGGDRGSVPSQKLSPVRIAQSGVTLPPEERVRDLELPTTLPERVRELGKKVLASASAQDSNYRLAQRLSLAIQQDAVYTLRPPTVPGGRDAADYFLFEGHRRGYCTYFAGALTVLCRTQGIPARVVSGFVNPTWSNSSDVGVLQEANAHAWTEVWVDGWGWTLVDATPADDRGDNAPTWYDNWKDFFSAGATNTTFWLRDRLVSVAVVGAFIAVLFLILRRKRRLGLAFWHKIPPPEDVERRAVIEVYRRTARKIARRFRPRASWETPDEWLQPFVATLSPTDAEALRRLTSLYMAARYGSRPLPKGSAQLARETVSQVGWRQVA
jgi:hypothetical protein